MGRVLFAVHVRTAGETVDVDEDAGVAVGVDAGNADGRAGLGGPAARKVELGARGVELHAVLAVGGVESGDLDAQEVLAVSDASGELEVDPAVVLDQVVDAQTVVEGSNVSSQILNHLALCALALAALSTLAMYAVTGPLCDGAIGLSGSLGNWAPPMTCWYHAPISSPALTSMTLSEVEPGVPHVSEALVASCTGLLFVGARSPTSEPWSAPFTVSF